VGDTRDARRFVASNAIARENRNAAVTPGLDPADPRWVLAVRAKSQMQGSILTPERRERVMETARQLGVRPFDASVIVAIVQDQARRGGTLTDAGPAIAMVDDPPERGRGLPWGQIVAALATAAVGTALLIRWLLA
jgi:hypothetical protein